MLKDHKSTSDANPFVEVENAEGFSISLQTFKIRGGVVIVKKYDFLFNDNYPFFVGFLLQHPLWCNCSRSAWWGIYLSEPERQNSTTIKLIGGDWLLG